MSSYRTVGRRLRSPPAPRLRRLVIRLPKAATGEVRLNLHAAEKRTILLD